MTMTPAVVATYLDDLETEAQRLLGELGGSSVPGSRGHPRPGNTHDDCGHAGEQVDLILGDARI
jgi:hypothetical protein